MILRQSSGGIKINILDLSIFLSFWKEVCIEKAISRVILTTLLRRIARERTIFIIWHDIFCQMFCFFVYLLNLLIRG